MRATGGPRLDYGRDPQAYLTELAYNEGAREAFEVMRDRLLELFHYELPTAVPVEVPDEVGVSLPASQYLDQLHVRHSAENPPSPAD